MAPRSMANTASGKLPASTSGCSFTSSVQGRRACALIDVYVRPAATAVSARPRSDNPKPLPACARFPAGTQYGSLFGPGRLAQFFQDSFQFRDALAGHRQFLVVVDHAEMLMVEP